MTTRSSLRVWPLRDSTSTAAKRPLGISTSMHLVNGKSIRQLSMLAMYIIHHCSFELNLSAKDSPLKIIRHYHPNAEKKSEMDKTLKVRNLD